MLSVSPATKTPLVVSCDSRQEVGVIGAGLEIKLNVGVRAEVDGRRWILHPTKNSAGDGTNGTRVASGTMVGVATGGAGGFVGVATTGATLRCSCAYTGGPGARLTIAINISHMLIDAQPANTYNAHGRTRAGRLRRGAGDGSIATGCALLSVAGVG